MFFRLPKMFKILRMALRERIGIQCHYFIMLALMFCRYMKEKFLQHEPDMEVFRIMLQEIDDGSFYKQISSMFLYLNDFEYI